MHLPSHPQYNDIHTWTKHTHNYNANPTLDFNDKAIYIYIYTYQYHTWKNCKLAISTTIKPQPQLSTGWQFASGIKFIESTRNEKNISINQIIKILSLISKWNCCLQRYNYPWKAFGSSKIIYTNIRSQSLRFVLLLLLQTQHVQSL